MAGGLFHGGTAGGWLRRFVCEWLVAAPERPPAVPVFCLSEVPLFTPAVFPRGGTVYKISMQDAYTVCALIHSLGAESDRQGGCQGGSYRNLNSDHTISSSPSSIGGRGAFQRSKAKRQ
jgi:hypothetical protein